jgi:tripartite ATP-independent transporter DctM subunit
MTLVLTLSILVAALFIGIPLAFAIGASSLTYFLTERPDFIFSFPQRIWAGTNSFVIIAMPLFIFAGELMNSGGLSKRLIDFCLVILRPVRGGLSEVSIVASMIFGGISGSSVADTSALGGVLIPAMAKQGYPKGFSAGVVVAASTMGMIIPPSIPMLIFAMVSGASVGALFLAGAVPGIAIGVLQLAVSYTRSLRNGYLPEPTPIAAGAVGRILLESLPAALMPIAIILSIALGIATASESAGIAVLYALLVGFFLYRELTVTKVVQALKKTAMISSSIMIIMGFCTVFCWILAVEHVTVGISDFLMRMNVTKWEFLLFLDALILFFGFFMDVAPIILLLSPTMLPIATRFGVDPLQFGTILIVGTAIGLVTPPVGMCLNVATKICGLSITRIFVEAFPWLICNVAILALVTFVPEMSLWLPSVMK